MALLTVKNARYTLREVKPCLLMGGITTDAYNTIFAPAWFALYRCVADQIGMSRADQEDQLQFPMELAETPLNEQAACLYREFISAIRRIWGDRIAATFE